MQAKKSLLILVAHQGSSVVHLLLVKNSSQFLVYWKQEIKGGNLGYCNCETLSGQRSSTALPPLWDRARISDLAAKMRNAFKCTSYHMSNDPLFDSLYIIQFFMPFLPVPPFSEISCLDEVWEVNAFKYISYPLIFLYSFYLFIFAEHMDQKQNKRAKISCTFVIVLS